MSKLFCPELLVRYWMQVQNLAYHVKHRDVHPDRWVHGCSCGRCVAAINRAYT